MEAEHAAPERNLTAGALALAVIPLALAVLVTSLHGSLSIPHNDDWAYVKPARILAATGHLRMQGWVAASLLGQIVTAAPLLRVFGNSTLVLNLSVTVVAALSVLATYRLALTFLPVRRSLCAAALAVVFPGALLLGTSFMSDFPALLLELLCLLTGLRALGTARQSRWLTLSLFLGLYAVTVRQQALAAPLAVLIAVLLTRPQRSRTALLGASFLALTVAFLAYRSGVPHADNAAVARLDLRSLVINGGRAVATLGLVLLPAVGLVVSRLSRLVRRREAWAGSAVVLLLVLVTAKLGGSLLTGNYLASDGAYGAAGYGSQPLFPQPLFHALEVLGAGSAIALGGLLAVGAVDIARARRLSPPALLLGAFALLYAGALLAPSATGLPIFDRYLMPLVLPLVVGLSRSLDLLPTAAPSRQRAGVGLAAFAGIGLAVITSVLTLAAAADDAARWHVSTDLVKSGAAPTAVSSGLEWQGTWAAEPAEDQRLSAPRPADNLAYFTPMFPTSRDCYVVTRSRTTFALATLEQVRSYSRVPLLQQGHLYVYRSTASGC